MLKIQILNGYVSSFNNNGFTLTPGTYSGYESGDVNMSGRTYVGWSWKLLVETKGVFNVDDVGYANASDVNMNVGAFDMVLFTQSQVWSGLLSHLPMGLTRMHLMHSMVFYPQALD